MTTQVTQCPKCNTSFRVTDAQLGIANGAVRCGSCLHIFSAPDHWLSNPPEVAATPNQQPESRPTDSDALDIPADKGDEKLIRDTIEQKALDDIFDGDILDDDTDLSQMAEELLKDDIDEQTSAQKAQYTDIETSDALSSLQSTSNTAESDTEFEINLDDLITDEELIDDETPLQDADLIIEEELIDDSDLIGNAHSSSIINTDDDLIDVADIRPEPEDDLSANPTGAFSNSFLELDEQEENPLAIFKELDEIGEDENPEQDDWARKLLEEDDEEEPPSSSAITTPENQSNNEPDLFDDFPDIFESLEEEEEETHSPLDPELLDILNERDQATDEPEAEEDVFILGNESMVAGSRIGSDKSALLANIEPEPVEMATLQNHNLWIQRAWKTSIAAALLLFAVQYIHFNFDRISRHESYRPILVNACSILGCKLPDLDDIGLIRSSNLIVRSHPRASQALVVDAILINRAKFKQPFPIMELQFTDLSGQVVAGRRFKPAEYLAGELAGSTIMPVKQPIHISLEITDPGEQAVNYLLRFHPLEDS